jgi:hypothetical protein
VVRLSTSPPSFIFPFPSIKTGKINKTNLQTRANQVFKNQTGKPNLARLLSKILSNSIRYAFTRMKVCPMVENERAGARE